MATFTARPRWSVRGLSNSRKDAYWIAPIAIIATLTLFIVYSTWRAFSGDYYASFGEFHHARHAIEPFYFSPFYSPHLSLHWHLGAWPISPALYVLILPLSFRLSCYYCR